MSSTTVDIACVGYRVKADVYEGSPSGPLLLSLIGRTSHRCKEHYRDLYPRLAEELGITSVIFDYSGHGDSPFCYEELCAAQHLLETVTVYDWMVNQYRERQIFVTGSSYGGYLAANLVQYRSCDGLILRAPAIYRHEDLYTVVKDEDIPGTEVFRHDSGAIAKHPVLYMARQFEGKSLVIVHDEDERIPKFVTDAYVSSFGSDVVFMEGIPHSLDSTTDEQVVYYNQHMLTWLKAQMGGEV